MNAEEKWGGNRDQHASTAPPIEPSDKALENPQVRAAYDSSMKAAREAYLSGTDPTHGAVYAIQLRSRDRSNYVFGKQKPEGVPLSTQSGPYDNSYPNHRVPSISAWLNTYWDK